VEIFVPASVTPAPPPAMSELHWDSHWWTVVGLRFWRPVRDFARADRHPDPPDHPTLHPTATSPGIRKTSGFLADHEMSSADFGVP
jgi:hypothetical protein